MLRIGNVTIADEWREPQRAAETPYARRDSRHLTFDADGVAGEVFLDFGTDLTRSLRIASGETVGFLTTEEKNALVQLYLTGGTFELEWDRLTTPAILNPTSSILDARFEVGLPPVFTLVNEQADLWYMDIVLRVWEQEES